MKTLLELEPGDCRFPYESKEDGPEFVFCAKPKHIYLREGKLCRSPWCHEHYLRCVYVPAPSRQRSAA